MISATSTPVYFGGSNSATSGTAPKKSLDKDAFMTLLVAQLKNQDPSSPLQPYELAAQLAQFTSVEQLTQLNTAVAAQTQAAQVANLSAQSALSASLIGRQIEAVGNQMQVVSGTQPRITVDIGGTGGRGTLSLMDSSGKIIETRDLGSLQSGLSQSIALPKDLPPGTWSYSLDVKGAKDAPVNVTTYSTGIVGAIEFKNGEIVLQVGGISVNLSDLVRIEPAIVSSNGTPSTPSVPAPGRGESGPLGQPPVIPD